MQRNLPHIYSQATNAPLLLEPAYARVFFCALGREGGVNNLRIPQSEESLDTTDMTQVTTAFMSDGKRQARFYQVVDGIAVLPVTGSLVHKLGGMRPFSGMTGYDGVLGRLQQAIADPDVTGILLDIDSPGGQAAGAFDCADMIHRLRGEKPIWALANDMACSAAMLLAAACDRRLVTQTSRLGSIGVVMAHTSYAGQLEQDGVEITLIFSGGHKVDLNPYQSLPEDVRADCQKRMDDARTMFAEKVAQYTQLSLDDVLATEAAVYDGASAISVGLADEMVNAADAVNVMASAIRNPEKTGGNMSQLSAAEAVTQENQRVMGILTCPEAKGREAMAQMLASQPGMSLVQAQAILSSAPQQTTEAAVSVPERIMSLDEAVGREPLAQALAATPGMTLEQAKSLLALSPKAASLSDSIMALEETSGREELAQQLSSVPGMTLEQARSLLSAAPLPASGNSSAASGYFEQFMQQHSPDPVQAGTDNSTTTESQMLSMMPGN
ncbi:S49 family peptidase [Klebsiella pneumoniae]|uniref:S49 family peptidase n=1 Tax=Klebsiella pneumoniae TaxID=573 RepID=UPI003D1F745C